MTKLVMTAGFIVLTLLSWVLLLRDEQAISVLGSFYPQLGQFLTASRELLLHFGLNSLVSLLFALIVIIMFVGYFWSLRQNIPLKIAIVFAVIFPAVVFFSYPVLSTDVFDYILSDRLAVNLQANVWTTPPSALISPDDPYFRLTSWSSQVNPYGPVNQFFYSLAGLVSKDNFWISLAAHKLLPLIFLYATLIVTYKIMKKYYSQTLSYGIVLLFWNPLLIIETALSAHNDILMIFFILAAVYFWLGKRYFWSGLLLGLAVQVKLIPVVLFVFLLAWLVKTGWRNTFKFSLSFFLINLLALVYLGPAVIPFAQRMLLGSSVYWQSLPQLVHPFFPGEKSLISLIFLIFLIAELYRTYRYNLNPLTTYVETILIYLLFATSVYWNWYVLWILFLLPFLAKSRLVSPLLIFSATSLLAYPLYWLSLRLGPHAAPWQVIIYVFIIGPPLVSFVYEKTHQPVKN